MSDLKIQLKHDGETYYAQIATVDRTELGWEDHGILTAFLHCSWAGGGVGVGGFALDRPVRESDNARSTREGTAYGLDHVMKLIQTVGGPYASWEKLKGAKCLVLFGDEDSWGSQALGVASLDGSRVFIPKAHAEQWRAREES